MTNDPLRVLLLTSTLSPNAGGLSVSVPGLAHGIDPLEGISVDVMGLRDPADPAAADQWGPRVHAFERKGPAALQFAPDMLRSLERLAPDLVDVQGLWTYPSMANLRHTQRHKKPYVVTPRGMLDPWAVNNSAWKKRIAMRAFEGSHLHGAACLRATAEMEAEHFRRLGLTNPIAIVPNGIELPALVEARPQAMRRLLFLSRLHPKKGVDLLLRSWSTLEPAFPDWELVIAGIDENGYESRLKQLSTQLKLNRVRFAGAVYGLDKQRLYREADLFVLPTHAENFGLVVAEALAQETPVITTINAPWSGLLSQGCGWWIELDQDLLTETVRRALTLPKQELAQMGHKGRDWVQNNFSAANVALAMKALYLWVGGRAPKPDFVHE